jgi:hypothetical protein
MAASQSVLEILIQAVDESSAALEGAQANFQELGQQAIATGAQIGLAGAALTAAHARVGSSAASVQESQDNLKQGVTDAMSTAADSTGAYSTRPKFLSQNPGLPLCEAEKAKLLDDLGGGVLAGENRRL